MEPVRYKKPMKIELFIENRELKKLLKEERELNKNLLSIIKKHSKICKASFNEHFSSGMKKILHE